MSNSAPVCTMFVDFRAAFDQLWFLGCIGLRNLGIPSSFLSWIEVWLNNRRCFIEINGNKSHCFSIEKGGPQGSVLTPTLFITYNCDMCSSLSGCINHFFADDLAEIMAGQLGINYSSQCLDLEKRIKVFLDNLDYYSCLSDQPINFNKTKAMFSARAIGHRKFFINFLQDTMNIIEWTSEYKYLSYIISPKLGWATKQVKYGLLPKFDESFVHRQDAQGTYDYVRQMVKTFRTQLTTTYIQSLAHEYELLSDEIKCMIEGMPQDNDDGFYVEPGYAAFKQYHDRRENRLNLEIEKSLYFFEEKRVEGTSKYRKQEEEEIIDPAPLRQMPENFLVPQ
ncbi:unnamed protein product [Rotaria socialis]